MLDLDGMGFRTVVSVRLVVGFSDIRFRDLHVDYLIYTWHATISQILQFK